MTDNADYGWEIPAERIKFSKNSIRDRLRYAWGRVTKPIRATHRQCMFNIRGYHKQAGRITALHAPDAILNKYTLSYKKGSYTVFFKEDEILQKSAIENATHKKVEVRSNKYNEITSIAINGATILQRTPRLKHTKT